MSRITAGLGKSCLFGKLCLSFEIDYQFVYVLLFHFGYEGGMWDFVVLIPDHYLSIFFPPFQKGGKTDTERVVSFESKLMHQKSKSLAEGK